MEIDTVVSLQAAGPARMNCGIVPGVKGPRDVSPAGIAAVIVGDGRTVRLQLSTNEARAWGEMFLVCACVAEGGSPPVIAPPAPPIIVNGGH